MSSGANPKKDPLRGPLRGLDGKKPPSFTTGPARATDPDPDDDDDDEDFKKGNIDYDKMFMDQLLDGVSAANGAGYDDGDMLEEDDEMRDPNELCEEDLMIDEEEEAGEDEEKQPGGERTSKSESIPGGNRERKNFMDMNSEATEATGLTSSSAARDKGFRIQKKRSIPTNAQSTGATNTAIKKKPGSKSSSKKPYNEGAEENKGWLNDDNGASTT